MDYKHLKVTKIGVLTLMFSGVIFLYGALNLVEYLQMIREENKLYRFCKKYSEELDKLVDSKVFADRVSAARQGYGLDILQ